MDPVLYADLRCLQDPLYQLRGVGYHCACLLRQRFKGPCASWRLVGMVDDSLGELPKQYSCLVDEVSAVWNHSISNRGAVFIDMSPMTHGSDLTTRFLANTGFVNATVIYDFIPLDRPGYFPSSASRMDYLAKILRLRNFDLYFPISEYSAQRLADVVGASTAKTIVTGSTVRGALYEIMRGRIAKSSPYEAALPYFFSLGGGDRRKNTEVAVAAVRELNRGGSAVLLKVVGHYDPGYKADLLRVAGHEEGSGFLEFWEGVSDERLVELYCGAMATICPSHIEGFDLPVVESAVCGTPAIASACGAHLELIEQPEALFTSTDHKGLTAKLRRIQRDRSWREQLVKEQAPIAARYHEEQVGSRFWPALAGTVRTHVGAVTSRVGKRRVAFLSPYPPDQSGVARYTQLTIEAAAAYLNVDLYTNAPRPLKNDGHFHDAGKISSSPLLKADYSSIISVIGNSDFHLPIFEFVEKFGGPCILHDSRLTQIYYFRLGHDRFIEFASSLLGRPVEGDEVHLWLADQDPPSLFVDWILKRANPLIVHTPHYQALLRERYGVEAQLTTFCPNMTFSEQELLPQSRLAARHRLGIPNRTFVVSTFGYVARTKGLDSCIVALEMLRGWNIPAELHFVGSTHFGEMENEIARISKLFGVYEHVHWSRGFVDSATYRDFMLASDASVQLRRYGFGQPSAALADCISAAMPCVATNELALSCDAPDYILTVPARSSPLQIAEQLAEIWENGTDRRLNAGMRHHYLATHNFDYYIRRLREILDL